MPTTVAVDTRLITLPRTAESVPAARHWLADLLRDWHATDSYAELLLSETLTNAVCHPHTAGGTTTVTAARWDGRMRITVSDPDPRFYYRTPDDENGRGLLLIQQLADTFGWTRAGDGKVVWFELGIGEDR